MGIRRHTGIVLTGAPSIDVVDDAVRRGGYDTLKVVTGWGIPGGWTRDSIHQAAQVTPHLIVRTRSGDPSVDGRFGGDFAFVDQHRVEAEIYGWYRERRDIWVELGNEPNIFAMTETQMHEYAYFLNTAIGRCRVAFPEAQLIAPAMKIDEPNTEHFMKICQSAMQKADAIALHAYEWTTFAGPVAGRKGDLERAFALAAKLFPEKRWWLTEFGINDPKLSAATKGARCAALLHQQKLPDQLIGATRYHLNLNSGPDPEYHIYPLGDLAYHQARFGAA
jgi:hypothetical protein